MKRKDSTRKRRLGGWSGSTTLRARWTLAQLLAAAGRPLLIGVLLLVLSLGAAGVLAYVTTGQGALSWWNQVRAAELSPSSMVRPSSPADA